MPFVAAGKMTTGVRMLEVIIESPTDFIYSKRKGEISINPKRKRK